MLLQGEIDQVQLSARGGRAFGNSSRHSIFGESINLGGVSPSQAAHSFAISDRASEPSVRIDDCAICYDNISEN
jgi:hypothetical protein